MKKRITSIKSLILAAFCLFGGALTLTAQANLTLWHVNQAHIDNPKDGFANFWDCGYQYYIIYTGSESSTNFIIKMKNEGNQPLNLTSPLSLSAESASEFTIVSQPTKSTLQPNEDTHFEIQYIAPTTYNNAIAKLSIQSDDPSNSTCAINFEVGGWSPTPVIDLLCNNTEIHPSATTDLGTANLGSCAENTISKTFTIRNNNDNEGTVQASCGSDIVSITGADAADFTVTTQPANTISATNGTTTFVVSFAPNSSGVKNAQLCFDVSFPPILIGGGYTFNISGTGANCPISYESNNRLTFGDPCSCDDLLNCTSGGVTYFHDTLTIPATGTLASGLDLRITSAANFFTAVPCGGVLTTPTFSTGAGTGTQITEVGTSGVYKLEFWRPSGAQAALSVSDGGSPAVVAPAATFQPICTVAACTPVPVVPVAPIPTMSQWGLMIFGLLVLNLGVFFMFKKDDILKF